MTNTLDTALYYTEKMNFSIIPINPKNKKPFFPWKTYQTRRATQDEIKAWWQKYPKAMIGIATGKLSGIFVIDCDTKGGYEAIQKLIPDSLIFPIARTPRGGWHLYFLMPVNSNLTVGTALMPGVDYRGEGGYIIGTPSINVEGKSYTWENGLSLAEVELPELPPAISTYINKHLKREGASKNNRIDHIKPQLTTVDHKILTEGRRDNDLFTVANCLIKGGMQEGGARQVLDILAKNCNPPFPQKETQVKIDSALSRTSRRERNISQEVREWALTTVDHFLTTDCHKDLELTTRDHKKAANMALLRMVEEGLLEKGDRRGSFRVIDSSCEVMNFMDADTKTVDLKLPFNIHELVTFYPGNLLVIAGEPNAGKTAFLINLIKDNMQLFDIHYFNSEMGGGEFRKRLSKFNDMPLSEWKFKAWERSSNFADVIKHGPGKLNIIDFLEIHDNFYEVGGMLAEIHKKLKGALAVVAIQKNPGTDTGLGGFRTLEKPRLALAMSPGTLKIVKAKNWKTIENPNGQEIDFKLVQGCKFFTDKGWHRTKT